MKKLKFSELINMDALKIMSENLYASAGIPVGIIDVDGTILIATGWQKICEKYHRLNKITCARCKNSDNYIKDHINGSTCKYVGYKCKNNMWDIAMPIIICEEHVATVFVGQFFYEDEKIDEEFFCKQAKELGFDTKKYIAALHKVPVFSRNKVKHIMEYYAGLVTTLAESGYRLLEYKRSQEQVEKNQHYFKTVLDSVNDAIVMFDTKGRVIDVNESATHIYGYSREEFLNLSRTDLFSSNSLYYKLSMEEIINKMKEHNPLIMEDIVTNRQGEETWAEVNLHFTIIDNKETIVTSIRDITERKQAEIATRNQVLELDKLRTEFFANISHELRTPLNIIFSSNQIIEKYIQDTTKQIDREKILKNIKIEKQNCFRLLKLINNLLDMTKVDSGLVEINLINCDIVNVVEEITLSTAEYIASNNLKLIFDTDVEEKIIACDPDKIERIILNLLSNCVKFTDEFGSIFVNVIDGNDYITITVEDTGIGIPREKLECIFERFRQVDKSFTRNREGSGIGLSLVKSLVEMHGGNISVESEYGKGTKFIIKLPARTLDSHNNNENQAQYNSNMIDNLVERINIEFSDIYN